MRSTYHRLLSEIADSQPVATALPGAHELVEATRTHHTQPTNRSPHRQLPRNRHHQSRLGRLRSLTLHHQRLGRLLPPPTAKTLTPPTRRHRTIRSLEKHNPQSPISHYHRRHHPRCHLRQSQRLPILAVATGHDDAATLKDAGADLVVDDLTKTGDLIEWMMHR